MPTANPRSEHSHLSCFHHQARCSMPASHDFNWHRFWMSTYCPRCRTLMTSGFSAHQRELVHSLFVMSWCGRGRFPFEPPLLPNSKSLSGEYLPDVVSISFKGIGSGAGPALICVPFVTSSVREPRVLNDCESRQLLTLSLRSFLLCGSSALRVGRRVSDSLLVALHQP